MKTIDINDIENIEVDGVDTKDYPDFSDAFFSYAIYKDTGIELTEDELEQLAEDYPERLTEMAFQYYI